MEGWRTREGLDKDDQDRREFTRFREALESGRMTSDMPVGDFLKLDERPQRVPRR